MCHLESFVALNLYAVFQVWNDSFVYISETQSGMPLSKPRAYPIQSHETSQNCSLLPISCHFLKLKSDFRLISLKEIYIIYVLYIYIYIHVLVSQHSILHFVPPFFCEKSPRSHGKICSIQSSNGRGPTPQSGAEKPPLGGGWIGESLGREPCRAV